MILALVLTVITEGVIMFFLTGSKEWVKYNVYCNFVTNPLLNLVLLGMSYLCADMENAVLRALFSYYLPVILLEVLVFWGEGRLYFMMTNAPKKYCIRLSSICSYCILYAFQYIITLFIAYKEC